ncbi:unnamed protein product, partial [Polarella glacialis]
VSELLKRTPPWQRFDLVNEVIGGSSEVAALVAERFVDFQADNGVFYTEVRYDPVRLARSGLANSSISQLEVVQAVQRGLVAGMQRHGGMQVHQLLCAMRGQPATACLALAQLAAATRSPEHGGVVGLDLAGDERDFPNGAYVKCLRHAKTVLGLNTTVHAGENT